MVFGTKNLSPVGANPLCRDKKSISPASCLKDLPSFGYSFGTSFGIGSKSMSNRRRRRGVVLLIVTVMLLIISATAVGLVTLAQIEYRVTKLHGEEIVLDQLALSAETYLWEIARSPTEQKRLLADPLFNPEINRPIDLVSDDPLDAKFSFYPTGHFNLGGNPTLGWTNESDKLNLIQLVNWERVMPGQAMKSLMEIPGMEPQLARRILAGVGLNVGSLDSFDSIESGNLPLSGSAQADNLTVYRSPPGSMEELALRCGGDMQVWFGDDLTPKSSAASLEDDFKSAERGSVELSDTLDQTVLADYLTLVSRERNESFSGRKRIDLNQSDLTALHSTLLSRLGKELADFVILYRQYGPSEDVGLETISDLSVNLHRPATVRIDSELDLIGCSVVLTMPSGRRVKVDSPLSASPANWGRRLQQIFDELTVDSRETIPGRVNLLSAPREILLAIPGMDSQLVDQILIARSLSVTPMGTELFHPVWLLEQELIDVERAKGLLPYLTVAGDVLQARIEAFLPEKKYRVHRIIMVDGTHAVRGRLYLRDLP